MNIIVHGSIAYDRIMNYPGYFQDHILPDKIHNINVSFYIEKVTEMRGGTGGNIVYNLALLEEKPVIITNVGKDADSYLSFLYGMGIDTTHVGFHDNELTAGATIITDRANNQITAFSPGAAGTPATFDFESVDPKNTIILFAPANNKADVLKFIDEAKRLGIPYMFDPGQTIAEFNGEELARCIEGSLAFTSNDYELELVKQRTGLKMEDILQKTGFTITTLGVKGSVVKKWSGEPIEFPASMQETMKDPTGAGDAYRAGFMKGLLHGLPLADCGQLGACAASFVIEHIGTQEHVFSMDEFRTRYVGFFRTECPV